MKRKTRIAALIMAASMLAGVLAGCADNSNSGSSGTSSTSSTSSTASGSTEATPVIEYYYPVAPSEHDKVMWDALNPYLIETANVEVNYHPIDWGEYGDRTATIVSAGQSFDVMFCNATYFQKVQLGAAMPVEEYLQSMDIWDALPEWLWDAATVDGHIYGVPTYKDCASVPGLIYNKTLLADIGVEVPTSYKKLMEMEELFYETKEKRDAKYPEDANIPILTENQYIFNGVDNTGTDFAVSNIPGMETCEGMGSGEILFNVYAQPEYVTVGNLMRKWVQEGIYPVDGTNYDAERGIQNSGKIAFRCVLGFVNVDPHMWGEDFEIGFIPSENRFVSTEYVMFGSNIVGGKSENPEAAVRFLNAVNTDNYVANTIRFGVEGDYWNKTEDNRLDFTGTLNGDPQQRAYYNWYGWQFGKLFTMSLPAQESDTLWEDLIEANENAYASDNMGWTFDQSNVTTEIASCSAIKDEYRDNLLNGMVEDPAGALATMNERLKAAGVEKITAEAQAQLNEWRAASGKTVAQ